MSSLAGWSVTVSEFFEGRPDSREFFETVHEAINACGPATVDVSKSQVAFRRRRRFAAAWVPDRYLHGQHAPLVLTLFLPHHEQSSRWKEVVEPVPGRFTHHLELAGPEEVDAEVARLLELAWKAAG